MYARYVVVLHFWAKSTNNSMFYADQEKQKELIALCNVWKNAQGHICNKQLSFWN